MEFRFHWIPIVVLSMVLFYCFLFSQFYFKCQYFNTLGIIFLATHDKIITSKYIRGVYVSCSVMSDSLQPHGLLLTRPLCPWNFPGKNTGVGCHSLLQGIIPTQGSNPGLLLGRQILYHCATWGASDLLGPLPHFYSRASLPLFLSTSSVPVCTPQPAALTND